MIHVLDIDKGFYNELPVKNEVRKIDTIKQKAGIL